MTPSEVTQTIAKLRREMPRNSTAMALCEAAEQMMAKPKAGKNPLTRAEIQRNYRIRKELGISAPKREKRETEKL